jgi:hypothetical protein
MTNPSLTALQARIEQLRQAADALRQATDVVVDKLPLLVGRPTPRAAPTSAAATVNRQIVYVHGICRHDAGFSDGWWDSLHPFTDEFGAGVRDATRKEVLWSDLVNSSNVAASFAAMEENNEDEANEWSAAIRGVLEERSASLALETTPSVMDPAIARLQLTVNMGAQNIFGAPGLSIPGFNCIDDFAVYMFDENKRAEIIARFTDVVGPLVKAGVEIDIIAHSWGTVVAYEGLRELADGGQTQTNVRNFFTVGAALAIFLAKKRLRPQNQDGRRPAMVRRWVNINAAGDPVGGRLMGRPYQVDVESLQVPNLGCGFLDASCAHGSYFVANNLVVNRDIFGHFTNLP